ncbi:hypothetical protein EVAR_53579_1 [Eumeta japonica]|uniref:Uncharacterized protein n=1 Tax=Eumeta variegata TaxID=151549 RepID=A0A4C1YHH3_EUMVA|nr:hypothetical protein EVAR_53579_1 [Eumeta japonica]
MTREKVGFSAHVVCDPRLRLGPQIIPAPRIRYTCVGLNELNGMKYLGRSRPTVVGCLKVLRHENPRSMFWPCSEHPVAEISTSIHGGKSLFHAILLNNLSRRMGSSEGPVIEHSVCYQDDCDWK